MSWLRRPGHGWMLRRALAALIILGVLFIDYLIPPRPVRRALAAIGRRSRP